jgi:uncharacterized Ntn-hydrolase superfamily protein
VTFSIVAFDPSNGDLGVAVESKFIAVGSVVPWAKAGVGAIATQAASNISFGPQGLRMLEDGLSASEALQKLLETDLAPETRQLAIVDVKGGVAAHTGKDCLNWAGHVIGSGFSCQGNILASSSVVTSMAKAYKETPGDLIEKLLQALTAGQAAGGDRRGQQSSALLVVRKKGGYEGYTDRYVDLRVDEHPAPIDEMKRIFRIYDMTMLSREDPSNLLAIDEKITIALQRDLKKLRLYDGEVNGTFDQATRQALTNLVNINNFENKMRDDGRIWKSVLGYLEEVAREA